MEADVQFAHSAGTAWGEEGRKGPETPSSPAHIFSARLLAQSDILFFCFCLEFCIIIFFWPMSDVLFCTVLSLDLQLCCSLDSGVS